MRIASLHPQKYKRFFAFGCSFTNYVWPTWADIISQDIPVYQNWGSAGSGNHFIFNSIIEANARYQFNNTDLVVVMWTNKEREDRYHNNNWLSASYLNLQKVYGKDWFMKYGIDSKGFLVRDLALINTAQSLLNSCNCDWENFMINPIINISDALATAAGYNLDTMPTQEKFKYWVNAFDNLCENGFIDPLIEHKEVVEVYKDTFKNINKSFEGRWDYEYKASRNLVLGDIHPTPLEALIFLDNVWPDNTLGQTARNFARHWDQTIRNVNSVDSLDFKRPVVTRL